MPTIDLNEIFEGDHGIAVEISGSRYGAEDGFPMGIQDETKNAAPVSNIRDGINLNNNRADEAPDVLDSKLREMVKTGVLNVQTTAVRFTFHWTQMFGYERMINLKRPALHWNCQVLPSRVKV